MVNRQLDPWKFVVCHFAHQKNCSTSHLVLTLKLLLFKSFDWRGSEAVECCIGLGDIAAAFEVPFVVSFFVLNLGPINGSTKAVV